MFEEKILFLDALSSNSIKHGKLLFPFRALPQHINGFVDPAVFYNKIESPFQYSKSGSLTKLKYKENFVALTTDHQFSCAGYSYDQIAIFGNQGKTLHTAGAVHFVEATRDIIEEHDIVFADFSEAVVRGGTSRYSWYDVSEELVSEDLSEPLVFICVGYPSDVNEIDYEGQHYGSTPFLVWGEGCINHLAKRKSFKPLSEVKYSPAGMSGGAVFGLTLRGQQLHLTFQGIASNASKEIFHFIPMRQLRSFMKKIF
jgi:hypothetical protein